MLDRVVARVPRPAAALIERFWPGPLTLVLPARAGLPPELTAGSGRIGVRISSHPLAHALVTALGTPITTTSANAAGAAPPADVGAAVAAFGPRVDAYLDGGVLAGGLPSTVLVVEDEMARVVRAGAVAIETLRAVLGATLIHSPD
jgi:L-threonylcarbamoyladenylate synthase